MAARSRVGTASGCWSRGRNRHGAGVRKPGRFGRKGSKHRLFRCRCHFFIGFLGSQAVVPRLSWPLISHLGFHATRDGCLRGGLEAFAGAPLGLAQEALSDRSL